MFTARKERITKEREARRSEITDVAEKLFREKGFAKTSVDEIVNAIGIAKGTFFYHFPAKEDVLVALGERRLASFRASMRKRLEDPAMPPEEKVSRFFGELAALRTMRRAVDWIGFGLIREDPVIHNTLVNLVLAPLVDDLTTIIDQGIAAGRFRVHNSRSTALCLILLCADLLHRTANTEKIVPWKHLRQTVWEIVTRSLGMKDPPDNPPLTGR